MSEDNAAFTATMKAGPGFEAPWLVVRADTADALKARLREAYSDLVGPLLATAEVLAGEYSGGGSKPAQNTTQNQGGGNNYNQGGGQPQGNAPTCAHGTMVWKEAKPDSGKTWKGHFCPSRDRNNQCDPVWPPKN